MPSVNRLQVKKRVNKPARAVKKSACACAAPRAHGQQSFRVPDKSYRKEANHMGTRLVSSFTS